jgi:polysaccharide export outer membrane protein
MRLFFFFLLAGTVLVFSSCRTQKIVYNYLEDLKDTTAKKEFYISEPFIQKNDLLSVQIYSSSLDPTVDQLYNLGMGIQGGSSGSQQSAAITYGYLVDQKGNIELPRLGIIHSEGLTKEQLGDTIKSKLKGQLNDPTVIIRFLNFRIIVMGEVGSPGVKTVPVENLTLLEALAMAGDITLYGKKKEVKILRENSGKRQLGIVDVTSTSMFESPYYQLQQNDVILVEQTKYKIATTEQSRISQQLGFALSIITSIALLYNIFK